MSRATRLSRTIRRAVERQLEKTESKKPPRRNRLVKFLVFLIGVPSLLAGVLFFVPHVSVTPTDPTDQTQPFSSSFTIANATIIPLHDVSAGIHPVEIKGGGLYFNEGDRPPIESYPDMFVITMPNWSHHNLTMDEKFTITTEPVLGMGQGATLAGADIAIVVRYHVWKIPIERQQVFRFVTHRYRNGIYSWFSHPLN
jgi:hypothetical protein